MNKNKHVEFMYGGVTTRKERWAVDFREFGKYFLVCVGKEKTQFDATIMLTQGIKEFISVRIIKIHHKNSFQVLLYKIFSGRRFANVTMMSNHEL